MNENNFTSRVWWALIEKVTPCAIERLRWLAVVRRRWLAVLVATTCTYTCVFLADPVTFSMLQLADTIAADSRLADNDPLGSGSLLIGFRLR